MSLYDMVRVNIPLMSTGTGRWHNPDFATYGTVAFDRDMMRRMIGFGTAVTDQDGKFLGFVGAAGPHDRVIGPRLPFNALNLYVWLLMVPEVYREELEGLAEWLWQRHGMTKIDPHRGHFDAVDSIREWIGQHIEPTSEHEPRSVRFANAWYELGVRVAYDQGRITMAEADELLR